LEVPVFHEPERNATGGRASSNEVDVLRAHCVVAGHGKRLNLSASMQFAFRKGFHAVQTRSSFKSNRACSFGVDLLFAGGDIVLSLLQLNLPFKRLAR